MCGLWMKLTMTLCSHRVTEQAEENKMTASNLGIIFGPTLIKPRQTDAEVSLSSLVDYPYQALMVELLVRHFQTIFDMSLLSGSDITTAGQASPRLTPQEKVQRLSRYSTSLMDIKEVRRDGGVISLLWHVLILLLWKQSSGAEDDLSCN